MRDIHQNEIAFLGKITAGATHEMKNILAIIQESSGLMEDLMTLTPQVSVHQDKIQRALATISAQVKRGVELSTRLNQFAHSTDIPARPISPLETTALIVELAGRFARLKNVTLSSRPPEPDDAADRLTTRPIRLQMVLLTAIECWLDLSSPGQRIFVYPVKQERAFLFVVECQGGPAADDPALQTLPRWPVLQDMIAGLDGQLEVANAPPRILICLSDVKTINGD